MVNHRSDGRPPPLSAAGPNPIVLAREELRDPPLYTEAISPDKLPFLARLYTGVLPTVFGNNALELQNCGKVVKSGAICLGIDKQ